MDIFETDDNSTPLTADEKDGLKLKWITLRSELSGSSKYCSGSDLAFE